MKVGLIGNGYLGKAYARMFPDAPIYDPYALKDKSATKEDINSCGMAIIMVPTDPLPDGSLNTGIVEEVVDWLETDLILIKSALMPGTVDRLVEKTGKKVAVGVEYIGLGNYYIDSHDYPDSKRPERHKLIVIGGELSVAEACANVLWSQMSPDVRIHLVSAREAEIVKLTENFYGAYKVTFSNCLYNLSEKSNQSPIRIHQAWSEDGRVDKMHTRVVPGKRGWKSHCYSKDIMAYQCYAKSIGADDMAELAQKIIDLNKEHLALNE